MLEKKNDSDVVEEGQLVYIKGQEERQSEVFYANVDVCRNLEKVENYLCSFAIAFRCLSSLPEFSLMLVVKDKNESVEDSVWFGAFSLL